MNVLTVRSCREPKGLEAPEMWRTQRGFTLLEMMVVIAIIGLIAALVVPQIMGHMDKARAKTTKLQIRELENAVDLFKLENGFYPARLEDLVVRPANVKTWPPNGYMKELPVERLFRLARLLRIGGGTSEIQRWVIARSLGL